MTSSASSIRTIVSGGDSADRRNGELQFVSSTLGQGLGKISFTHDATNTNRVLKFKIDDNENMTILENGKVGIGVPNPGGILDIQGSHRVTHFNHLGDEHTYIRGGKNTSNVIINDGGGNVGIGLTPQYSKLQIDGNILLAGGTNGHDFTGNRYVGIHGTSGSIGSNGFSGIEIESSSGSQNVHIHSHTNGVGSGRRMTIHKSGAVNIGGYTTTTFGNSRVYIAGALNGGNTTVSDHYEIWHKYDIDTNPASTTRAGFVFTPNQSLVSLAVANDIYISGNGHALRVTSDKRIKKDIQNVNNLDYLNLLRQVDVKKFKYVDRTRNTNEDFIGFIAQEVKSFIPNSVKISKEYLPNIYTFGESLKISENIYKINLSKDIEFDEANIDKNIKLLVEVSDDKIEELFVKIKNIISNHEFEIETDKFVSKKVFVYGEEVNDFHTLNETPIFTTTVAAVKQIDEEQQADKEKIINLENELLTVKQQYNDLLSRIKALEKK